MKNTLTYLNILLSILLGMTGCKKKQHQLRKSSLLYEQSVIQAAKDNMNGALQLINAALVLSDEWHLHASKANYLYAMHDFEQAAQIFNMVLTRRDIPRPIYLELSNNYACTLHHLGQIEQAAHLWERISKDPSYVTPEVAWFNLGILAFKAQEYNKALTLFDKAITRCPDYIDALFYKALVLGDQEQLQPACATLKKLVAMMPEHMPARMLLDQWGASL